MDDTEFVLHEIGESVAIAISSAQRELEKYPNGLGTFVLDEVEIKIPLVMHLDHFGQVRAHVIDSAHPHEQAGYIRLRLRSTENHVPTPPVGADSPLDILGMLSEEAISRLHAERIFSIHDLLRVTRSPAGRLALDQMELGVGVNPLIERALVVTLPMVPAEVTKQLVDSDLHIDSIRDFVRFDPGQIADYLTSTLGEPIRIDDVTAWQESVRAYVQVPLPKTPLDVSPEINR